MKRLAFILIALFSLNIAYVFSQESQESQESSSFRSGGGSGSSIDDFFPIWGITLGRTTWSQAQGEYSEGLKTYSIKLETYGQNHLRLRIGLLYKKP
jgi:hypothetical protein